MLESTFQTFLLLAYFDIAMLSIIIANYAVSASYLGRETRLSRQRMERKEAELITELNKLNKLNKEPQISEIERKIRESKAERRRLSIRIFLLSWLGAVILPSMFFIFSLILALVGMNSEIIFVDSPQFLQQQSMIFSIGTIAIGFMTLLVVIRTIDSAAKSIPVPQFETHFRSGLKREKLKGKETEEITVCVENVGEDIAEDLLILVNFHPEFKVHKTSRYFVTEQGIETEYLGYQAAICRVDNIHADTTLYIAIRLTTPEKQGDFEIPILIYERKTGKHKDKLIIQIVQ